MQRIDSIDEAIELIFVFVSLFFPIQLNAFETPALRASYTASKTKLDETQAYLDNMLAKCHYLEEQMVAKDNFYTNRERELDELHRQELDKGVTLFEWEYF